MTINKLFSALRILITFILSALLLINLYLIAARVIGGDDNPKFLGFFHAMVLSGSMEPEFSAGDLAVYRQQDGYVVGDIVMFRDGANFVTHRIIDEADDGLVTKGDANNTPDAHPLDPEKIEGRLIFVMPGVGSAMMFLKSPLGILALVIAALLMWAL